MMTVIHLAVTQIVMAALAAAIQSGHGEWREVGAF